MGGAIFNMQGALTIRDSTLAGNHAVGGSDNASDHGKGIGGAVFNMSGAFQADGSTFAGNSADYDGVSIYNLVYDGATARTAQTTLRDTIVWDATAQPDLTSIKTDYITPPSLGSANADVGQFDLVGAFSVKEHGTISGTPLVADPMLGPLANNGGLSQTMAPGSGSPVIDAGSAFGLTTDQRGLPRPSDFAQHGNAGDGADIGAVELQVPAGAGPPPAAFGARALVTLKLASRRIPARGPLSITVSNANAFTVTGRLSGRTAKAVAAAKSRRRVLKLKAKSFRVAGGRRATVRLALPTRLRRLLGRQHRLSLRLSASVKDPVGNARTVAKTMSVRLKKKKTTKRR
jgi:hypothetical protein